MVEDESRTGWGEGGLVVGIEDTAEGDLEVGHCSRRTMPMCARNMQHCKANL